MIKIENNCTFVCICQGQTNQKNTYLNNKNDIEEKCLLLISSLKYFLQQNYIKIICCIPEESDFIKKISKKTLNILNNFGVKIIYFKNNLIKKNSTVDDFMFNKQCCLCQIGEIETEYVTYIDSDIILKNFWKIIYNNFDFIGSKAGWHHNFSKINYLEKFKIINIENWPKVKYDDWTTPSSELENEYPLIFQGGFFSIKTKIKDNFFKLWHDNTLEYILLIKKTKKQPLYIDDQWTLTKTILQMNLKWCLKKPKNIIHYHNLENLKKSKYFKKFSNTFKNL